MPAVDALGHLRQVFEILVDGLNEHARTCAGRCHDPRAAHRDLDTYIRAKARHAPDAKPDLLALFYLLAPQLAPPKDNPPVFARVVDNQLVDDVDNVRQTRHKWAHFQPIGFAEAEATADSTETILRRTQTGDVARLRRLKQELSAGEQVCRRVAGTVYLGMASPQP